jgi:NitT/TauT family transport system permease protein
MSVTTSTSEDVSFEMRPYAREVEGIGKIERPARSARRRAFAPPPAAVQRVLPLLPSIVVAVILLLAWYLSTAYGHVPSLILPAPGDVFASLGNGLSSGLFQSNALVTIQESLFGFLLALAVALPLGYGLAKSRLIAAAIHPYLAAAQAIPAIVIAPLLGLWLGYGLGPNLILCMLIVLFPMVITTILGVQTIDPEVTDAARLDGAGGWSLLAHVEFPLALPAVLAGVRTSLTLSITGALVGELVNNSPTGLGYLILLAKNQYDLALMFATLVILALLAALYYGVSWLLTRLAAIVY